MKIKHTLLLILLSVAPLYAESAIEDLLNALQVESVERNPEGAINLYQKILDKPDSSPAVKAEARLRMGICYEKLDKFPEAAAMYRQILAEPSGASSTILRQTRNNLGRIQVEHPTVWGSSVTVQGPQTIPRRLSLLLGPDLLISQGGKPLTSLSMGLRFRTSAHSRPLAWFLEVRGTVPLGDSTVGDQSQEFDASGRDYASLSYQYQASLGLVRELPHGHQKTVVPEVGAGLAVTSAKIRYTSPSSSGELTQKTLSPYLQMGVQIFLQQNVSFLLQTRYVAAPYPQTVDIAAPPHSQNFPFPSSQWAIGGALQIKIGTRAKRPRP